MFELTIKRADGSTYWSCDFNSRREAEAWLAEERTRPYWVSEYATEILDKTSPPPPPPSALELIRRERALAYPPIGELADALVKNLNGDLAPLANYAAACLAVKAQYPKP